MCSISDPSDSVPGDVKSPRGRFLGHLVSYLAVNVGLLSLNLFTTPETVWAVWPLLGWGIGVIMHGLRYMASVGRQRTSSGGVTGTQAPDWSRIEKRLENLEAIATNDDLASVQAGKTSPHREEVEPADGEHSPRRSVE